MKKLHMIPRIKKLAESKGMKIESVDFVGNGICFVYRFGEKTTFRHSYDDVDFGIEEEFRRIRNFEYL